jgi:hypothetical protein
MSVSYCYREALISHKFHRWTQIFSTLVSCFHLRTLTVSTRFAAIKGIPGCISVHLINARKTLKLFVCKLIKFGRKIIF